MGRLRLPSIQITDIQVLTHRSRSGLRPMKVRRRRAWTAPPKHPHRTTRERASRHIRAIARKCTEVHRQI